MGNYPVCRSAPSVHSSYLAPGLEAAPRRPHEPPLEGVEGEGAGQVHDGTVHAHVREHSHVVVPAQEIPPEHQPIPKLTPY